MPITFGKRYAIKGLVLLSLENQYIKIKIESKTFQILWNTVDLFYSVNRLFLILESLYNTQLIHL